MVSPCAALLIQYLNIPIWGAFLSSPVDVTICFVACKKLRLLKSKNNNISIFFIIDELILIQYSMKYNSYVGLNPGRLMFTEQISIIKNQYKNNKKYL
jgi:hypothetical protein